MRARRLLALGTRRGVRIRQSHRTIRVSVLCVGRALCVRVVGVARIVIGAFLLLLGLVFLVTIIGFLVGIVFINLAIIFIASGASARGDAERMRRQQEQTNVLLQQQLQMSAMQASRQAAPAQYPPSPQYVSSAPPAPAAERYCPVCGMGNARAAVLCRKCGKPLPPPP
jgi:hypothetical protein